MLHLKDGIYPQTLNFAKEKIEEESVDQSGKDKGPHSCPKREKKAKTSQLRRYYTMIYIHVIFIYIYLYIIFFISYCNHIIIKS